MVAIPQAFERDETPTFPLHFSVAFPECSSRLATLLRIVTLPPFMLLASLVSILFGLGGVVGWFSVVVTGRYPKGLFDKMSGLIRWEANYLAFYHLLTDRFPRLTLSSEAASPVRFYLEYPERSSRILALARGIMLLPGTLVFMFVSFASFMMLPVSWFAILLTGKHPQWLFDFHEGTIRWDLRLTSYTYLLRDEYPPYSTQPDAPVSSNVTAFILGIVMIGIILTLFSQLADDSHDTGLEEVLRGDGILGLMHPDGSIDWTGRFVGGHASGAPVAWSGGQPVYRI